MNSHHYAVVLVFATSYAIRVEQLLNHAGMETRLIPVPRQLSSDCGMCVRIPHGKMDCARALLEENGCAFEGIYPLPPGSRG
jgi:hypothetical protein